MKNQQNIFRTKPGGKVKDVDGASRTVTGYFASFNTDDSDGDRFAPGCFAKSLNENKSRILHLLQHNPLMPLGRPEVLKEDETGLYFETRLANTPLANDTLQLYKDGIYNEHSVGFEMLQSSRQSSDKGKQSVGNDAGAGNLEPVTINVITQARLWEGSTVTWGANANTPFLGLKSMEAPDIIDYVLKRSELLRKHLHRGNLTEDTYIQMEVELKQLQSLLAAVASLPEETIATALSMKDKELDECYNVLKSINQMF